MFDRHLDNNRFTHVGLCVVDLKRSLAFYRDVLGFSEVARRLRVTDAGAANLLDFPAMDLELVYLERDGIRLELLSYRDPEVQRAEERRPMNLVGLTHLSFRVGDLGGLCERIDAGGGTVLPTTTATFGQGNRGVMTLDPDGIRIELIERPNI
jgi:glyoxylase I family protein